MVADVTLNINNEFIVKLYRCIDDMPVNTNKAVNLQTKYKEWVLSYI